jgi:hypothetical protein
VDQHPDDKEKTAFSTGQGLCHFTIMPFGLCNASPTFERLMEQVLRGLTYEKLLVYLNDLIVIGRTFQEHLLNLRKCSSGSEKSQLFQNVIRYLGHIVSLEGLTTDPENLKAVRKWPTSQNKHEIRSFLGLYTYCRQFISGFTSIVKQLAKFTEEKQAFHWTPEVRAAINTLKDALYTAPILAYPQPRKRFIFDTDASKFGIKGMLTQVEDGKEQTVPTAVRR